MHLQGPQAGVLLGAVFAVKGRPRRDLLGQGGRLLQGSVVGQLVLGQGREAAVAVAAVQAVVDGLDGIRARGVRGSPAVLFFFTAAAGWRAAEVQRCVGHGHRRERGEGRRYCVCVAPGKYLGGVAV